jgi:hypothetical protein
MRTSRAFLATHQNYDEYRGWILIWIKKATGNAAFRQWKRGTQMDAGCSESCLERLERTSPVPARGVAAARPHDWPKLRAISAMRSTTAPLSAPGRRRSASSSSRAAPALVIERGKR